MVVAPSRQLGRDGGVPDRRPSGRGDRPPHDARVLWVGAGTKDTGFSLTKLTFQITHATDSDTNAVRDYIIAELERNRVIADVNRYEYGEHLPVERVNHYVTDGKVIAASLVIKA